MFNKDLTDEYPESVKFLSSAIKKKKLANSYIFIGNESNDTLLIALNLAKILNCIENKEKYQAPCENCINCKWLEKREHPKAFINIEPDSASKKGQIRIDRIRELLVELKISQEFFRIVFFQKASLSYLPADCCNLLLKIIEETPTRTIFIFANKTKDDILQTILSRSQIISLNKRCGELVNLTNGSTLNVFPKSLLECFEKSKETQKYLNENKIELKDYLKNIALENYKTMKSSGLKEYCILYNVLQKSHLKLTSFIQTKIVLEDLFLELNRLKVNLL